jgi:hypothetical protein
MFQTNSVAIILQRGAVTRKIRQARYDPTADAHLQMDTARAPFTLLFHLISSSTA